MFRNAPTFSSFSTNSLADAKQFYGQVLGLEVEELPVPMSLLNVTLGSGSTLMIYPKDTHTPATFTVLNFRVPNVEEAVKGLVAKGVKMEIYEGFNQDEKGISRGEGPAIAWFKDPAGNILSVIEE